MGIYQKYIPFLLDKLLKNYEKKYPKLDLSEFKESAVQSIKTKLGLKILEDMAKI